MKIIHPIDKFFFELFPQLKGKTQDAIISELESFYSLKGIRPTISINDDIVVVDLDFTT